MLGLGRTGKGGASIRRGEGALAGAVRVVVVDAAGLSSLSFGLFDLEEERDWSGEMLRGY